MKDRTLGRVAYVLQ